MYLHLKLRRWEDLILKLLYQSSSYSLPVRSSRYVPSMQDSPSHYYYEANTAASGDLRLVNNFGSTSSSAGRFEIYYRGVWGTVCDDGFGSTEATAACRQLGFRGSIRHGDVGSLG